MPNFAGGSVSNVDGAKTITVLNTIYQLTYWIFIKLVHDIWETIDKFASSDFAWPFTIQLVGVVISFLAYGGLRVRFELALSRSRILMAFLTAIAWGEVLTFIGLFYLVIKSVIIGVVHGSWAFWTLLTSRLASQVWTILLIIGAYLDMKSAHSTRVAAAAAEYI